MVLHTFLVGGDSLSRGQWLSPWPAGAVQAPGLISGAGPWRRPFPPAAVGRPRWPPCLHYFRALRLLSWWFPGELVCVCACLSLFSGVGRPPGVGTRRCLGVGCAVVAVPVAGWEVEGLPGSPAELVPTSAFVAWVGGVATGTVGHVEDAGC